jgi:hypothetical protein
MPFSAKEYHGADFGVSNTKLKIQRNDGIRKDSRSVQEKSVISCDCQSKC